MPKNKNLPAVATNGSTAAVRPSQVHRGFIERVVSGPVLVDPDRIAEFEGCLFNMVGREQFESIAARQESISDDDYWPEPDSWECRYKPYNIVNGILQIPVMGALINRMGYQIGRYATGYTYIERALARGLEDANVKGIAFLVDSPGGEAAGNFELTDKIYAARGQKPMRSFVADMAYSGGFSIATAAPDVIVTRSGGTGSVGVVTMHVDMSGLLAEWGLKITFIKAGKFKVDGNRFEALSDTAKNRIQGRVDKIYDVFVSTVARNRAIDEDSVRGTEALTYDADESVEIGFANRIGAFEEEVAAFELEVAEQNGEVPMTKTDETVTKADHDAAVTQAKADGVAEGSKLTQERFAAVMSSEHYVGREAQATKMLTDPKMAGIDADTIIGVLESSPKVEASSDKSDKKGKKDEDGEDDGKEKASGKNHFKEHMDAEGGPEVGAGDGADVEDQNTPQANAARIMAAHNAATGKPVKKADAA